MVTKNLIDKIGEFFKTSYGLFLFTVKSLWVVLKTDMDKNVQTYKEEREEQKRVKKSGK